MIIHVAKQSQKISLLVIMVTFLKDWKGSRLDLEETLGEKVMLKSWVKVKKNWSKSLEHIQGLGIGAIKMQGMKPCFVLHTRPFSDTSLIADIFSESWEDVSAC